jgi:hypothetical protein
MRAYGLLLGAAVVLVCSAAASAARCSGVSNPVFCDDFDCWCGASPVPGATCTTACDASTTSPNLDAFYDFWIEEGACNGVNASTNLVGPGSDKYPTGWMAMVYQTNNPPPVRIMRNTHDMTPQITSHSLNTNHSGAINGAGEISLPLSTNNTIPPDYIDSMSRTARPQALKGQMWMTLSTSPDAYAQTIYYTELYLDDDRAPTNFTLQDCNSYHDCYPNTCQGGPKNGMPCTDDSQCSGGPNRPVLAKTDGTVHSSFAIGLMGPMDTNACDGDGSWESRLVVFDGLQWQSLGKANFSSIPSQGGVTDGCAASGKLYCADLFPYSGPGGPVNWVYFSIGADYIEIRLNNWRANSYGSQGALPDHDPGSGTKYYFVARVPRQYKGPFNKIAIGPGKGKDLDTPTCMNYGTESNPWRRCYKGSNDGNVCATDADCPANEECLASYASQNVGIDNLVLYDGVFQAAHTGACCDRSHGAPSCTDNVAAEDCLPPNVFSENKTCAESLCCGTPFADSDGDGDVDQTDFSAFQNCYTGPGSLFAMSTSCKCFDRDNNQNVDSDDWAKFEACASGPGIAANTACDGTP